MEKLSLKVGEVLRLLGSHELLPSTQLLADIDEAIELVHEVVRPSSYYRSFWRADIEDVLIGKNIQEHLGTAEKVLILACTLGSQVDFEIRRTQQFDMSMALIMDAVASVYVETYADYVELSLRSELREEGQHLSTRFAPGYGDFPLDTIPVFLSLLNQVNIPIHYDRSSLMTPLKSIVAILAIDEQGDQRVMDPCSVCLMKGQCALKTRGGYCGKFSKITF